MMKRHFLLLAITGLSLFSVGCQHRVFGVDEAVWNTLTEPEREKVIDGYNKRKEIELVNAQKGRERELENERHRQELEAQTAPIYAAADAVSSIWGYANKETHHRSVRIQSISTKGGKRVLMIGDDCFEVSLFSSMSHAWVKGQKIELSKNESDLFYPVNIRNLENGEVVSARRMK